VLDLLFFAPLLFGPWLLYRLTSALWERYLPRRRRSLLLTFFQLLLCCLLPYVIFAAGETWWQTHYGEHTGNAEFIQLDWGNFELGVNIWFFVSLFAALCLTLLVAVMQRERRKAVA